MPGQLVRIDSLDDPRIAPYRALKERELAREGGRFIAEAEYVVKRLLASDYQTESVLVSEHQLEEIAPLVADGVPIYVAPRPLVHAIVGFKFHSGVMACGRRGPRRALADVLPRQGPCTLVICPEISNTENLGALIRISAAFGVSAMILGQRCCDPFFRQCVRVSMGTIFRLPLVQSEDLGRDLQSLKRDWGVELAATVLDPQAEPLDGADRGLRLGLLLGNEAQGLTDEWLTHCQRRLTLPMQLGTDSLNVAVAAAVFLYHFRRPASR